jgi:hypothetical protein
MIKNAAPTFLYRVNVNELSRHFKEISTPSDESPYYQYGSKRFFGAIIRSQISLVRLDNELVTISVRLKGRNGQGQTVTGVKIDLITDDDPRIERYGLRPEKMPVVRIRVQANIKNNIILAPDPILAGVFIYRTREGASLIQFVAQD